MKKIIQSAVITVLTLCSVSVLAMPISYDFDFAVGDGFVAGSITTDGTLGQLDLDNIADFSFIANDGFDDFSFCCIGSGSVFSGTGDTLGLLTATDDELFLDVSGDGIINWRRFEGEEIFDFYIDAQADQLSIVHESYDIFGQLVSAHTQVESLTGMTLFSAAQSETGEPDPDSESVAA
ncbi:MAG: hypothetical protein HKM98_09440, partial [Gammaproteobacteria bacterium]|nr:hypothetical protein [Gammaproteobacteria bacterium]